MAYDAATGQVVLFGGFTSNSSGNISLSDTWTWDGSVWTQQFPQHIPPGRWGASMAYDAVTGQVVLFGGADFNGSVFGDTWTWNGSDWIQQALPGSPFARYWATMSTDSSGHVILFGGADASSNDHNDTWIWNGTAWMQQSPINPPPNRFQSAMAYDAATGQVVLFGGAENENNGDLLADTWTWDGTNWTAQSVTGPSARYGSAMAYDSTGGKVVLFGGVDYTATTDADTWTWNASGWAQLSPPTNAPARNNHSMAYDASASQVVLFGGFNTNNNNDPNFGLLNDTWTLQLSSFNFGRLPLTQAIPLTLFFSSGGTSLPPGGLQFNVFAQGALSCSLACNSSNVRSLSASNPSPLDFSLSGTPSYNSSGGTVSIAFTPLAPGLRLGALQVFNTVTNTVLITIPLQGVGQMPAIAFGPGVQNPVVTGTYALSGPKGVAVDSVGDVFIADTGNGRVVEVPAGCAVSGCQNTVGTGLKSPQGLAIDGAGDLLIADSGLSEVVEVPAGCALSTCQNTVGYSLLDPAGVAVDGAGDIFIADTGNGRVVEIPVGCTASTCQTTVGYNLHSPVAVTVDAAGDLFIADYGATEVVEVPTGCAISTCQITSVSGLSSPQDVKVDAAGDVFFADQGAGDVVEVPAGCANSNCWIKVGSGLTKPYGVAVDGAGDTFIADATNNQVVEVNRSQAPTLTFNNTIVNNTSTDSPKQVTVQNIGNQPLTGSLALTLAPNFAQGQNPDCATSFPLIPGATCGEKFSFTPQGASTFSGQAVFTDNALGGSNATQIINLSGTGVLTLTLSPASLPDATTGANYSVQLSATGGSGPYTFAVTGLPSSLSVNGSNQIVGLCTASSTNVKITVTDSETGVPQSIIQTYSLNCNPAPHITNSSPLPSGTVNVLYTAQLKTNAVYDPPGAAPYTWTLTPGTLPTTFSLSSTGQLSGTASSPVAANFSVTFTDRWGATTTSPFQLTINAVTYTLTTAVSPSGAGAVTPGGSYTAGTKVNLTATPSAGYAFVNWTSSPVAVANPNSAATTVTMPAAAETVTANFVPALGVNPTSLNFGQLYLGQTASKNVTLTNASTKSLTVSGAKISGGTAPSDFLPIYSCAPYIGFFPGTLPAGKSCTITVTFVATSKVLSPTAATSTLTITASMGSPQSVPLTATVIDPLATLIPSALNFGLVTAKTSVTKTATLTNPGLTALSITGMSVTGPNMSAFTLTPASNCGSSVAAGKSCTISITFTPPTKGNYTATLKVTDNALISPQGALLTGTGK